MKDRKGRLKNKADRLWQQIGKKLYGTTCRGCGKIFSEEEICGHHFVPKSLSLALRHDIKNYIPIQVACHMGIEFRKDPFITRKIEKWLVKQHGKGIFDYLEKRRHEVVQESIKYYEGIIESLNKLKLELTKREPS